MTDNGLVLDDIAPGSIRRIHLVGVAGTGMGSFAGMLKAAGYDVTGSDANVYPPMGDMLRQGAEVSALSAANGDPHEHRVRPRRHLSRHAALRVRVRAARRDNASRRSARGLRELSERGGHRAPGETRAGVDLWCRRALCRRL